MLSNELVEQIKILAKDIETRVIWNTAFNDPDEDTQLLTRAAILLSAVVAIHKEEIHWQEVADRIFLGKDI
jgi:hypothetical protein